MLPKVPIPTIITIVSLCLICPANTPKLNPAENLLREEDSSEGNSLQDCRPQLACFFVVEDHVLHTTQGLVNRAYVEELWELALSKIVAALRTHSGTSLQFLTGKAWMQLLGHSTLFHDAPYYSRGPRCHLQSNGAFTPNAKERPIFMLSLCRGVFRSGAARRGAKDAESAARKARQAKRERSGSGAARWTS
ncbi:hypothetical protein ILYODFUR_037262 [Ilyodon furcidens]|uniref:Uncharacterized protein n=1 Tax=Ilyodon furcidens TaxID=33524 RepID=A0ABV0TI77_9TELE